MKWGGGAGAPTPVARSAPNHGAPAANGEERSAVDAAADYYHYYNVDARDDCVGAAHVVTQAREAVGFAGAGDRGMIRSDGEAQGTREFEGASQMQRTSSSLTSATSMSAETGVRRG